MCWQKAIIDRYKEIYPKDSVRAIAQRVGIHYSRANRILSGAEMKVSEYEAFNNVIAKRSFSNDYSVKLFNQALSKLPPKKVQDFVHSLERSLINYQIVHKPIIENFEYIKGERG